MIDLDKMYLYVDVKWDEKIYKLRKIAVHEKDLLKSLQNVTNKNSLDIAGEILEILCGRFKETDVLFDEKKFRKTATFVMINEVMQVLMAGDKSDTG